MYHRYAVEVGGVDDRRAGLHLRDARRQHARRPKGVGVDDQRKALDALAATLKPAELTVPKPVLDLIPPRPPGCGMHRELFPRTTGERFDPLSPATIAADVTIGFMLQLDRAARMVAQHAVDPALPGLERSHRSAGRRRRSIEPTADAVRSGGPARRRARAGRSRDVAGQQRRRTAQVRAIASLQAVEAGGALRRPAVEQDRSSTRRSGSCWPPTSSASSSGRSIWRGRFRRGARRAARRADRRHAAGLAGAAGGLGLAQQ